MITRRHLHLILSVTCVLHIFLLPIASTGKAQSHNREHLVRSLTFFSSFDGDFKADYSLGDPVLYVSPEWSRRASEAAPAEPSGQVQIRPGEGVFGDALRIRNSDRPVFFYNGEGNIGYQQQDWEGTVSFWLRLSPDEDLEEGYSDPIQLTDSAWNDGALYVDFTYEVPRSFRFAFFAERDIWNPGLREWDEIAVGERPMIEVKNHPFSRDHWVHVAFTFRNFNTGEANGEATGYLNGRYAGTLSGREQTLLWDNTLSAIWLGYNYNGLMDELAIFNRPLTADEIRTIYELEQGIGELLPE